jgi:hypothetical protein
MNYLNSGVLQKIVTIGDGAQVNGWNLKFHPDFVRFYTTNRYLERLNIGSSKDSKRLIENKIRAICKSADPKSSNYPRLGSMKWLKAKKGVKIQEDRLTGDYRILFLPTDSGKNELTFFSVTDHDGVQQFLRDAHARVHNASLDEFEIKEHEESAEYTIDMTDDRAEQQIELIRKRFSEIAPSGEVDRNEENFLRIARQCSIYQLGKHGIELNPSSDQFKHIKASSPMLLPGVAGTGKSTVLQYRYRDAIEAHGEGTFPKLRNYGYDVVRNINSDNNEIKQKFTVYPQIWELHSISNKEWNYGRQAILDLIAKYGYQEFFKQAVYLTLNKPLADGTKRQIKQITSPEVHRNLNHSIIDVNSWVESLLRLHSPTHSETHKIIGFEHFRKWWSRRAELKTKYDPAQAWEEYRGVIKGTPRSLRERDGVLSKENYISLPKERCAYLGREREDFYVKIVEEFNRYRQEDLSNYLDDQDLFRELAELDLSPFLRYVFIDEVQDLTELQLKVMMDTAIVDSSCVCLEKRDSCSCPPSCTDCECLIFDVTGDLSQQVYPTRFRWEDTSRAMYDAFNIKCKSLEPMNISYRSVRSIVDLSSWYHNKMSSFNRQGGDITQAQSEQQCELPSVVEEEISEILYMLNSEKLPQPYCPIIVRNENKREKLISDLSEELKERVRREVEHEFPEDVGLQEHDFKEKTENNLKRIENYIFTIAQAKGLEWNNVILWEISSGSDRLLERKLHEKRGNVISDNDWNYQLELRHAFVGTTRARLLLLHIGILEADLAPNPFYNTLIHEELILVEKKPLDLSRFSIVELTHEEYEDLALDYEGRGLFGAAAIIYRQHLKKENEGVRMDFFESKKNGEGLLMAKYLVAHSEMDPSSNLVSEHGKENLDLLNIDGNDEELGYIIQIADALGDRNISRTATLRRKEKLVQSFPDQKGYLELAEAYEALEHWKKAAEFYVEGEKILDAIRSNYKANEYSDAWSLIIKHLKDNATEEYELLLVKLIANEVLSSDRKLFLKVFEIPLNDVFKRHLTDQSLSALDLKHKLSKDLRQEILQKNMTELERINLCFKNKNWEEGLSGYVLDTELDLTQGLVRCNHIELRDLNEWFANEIKLKPSQQYEYLEYVFKRFKGKKKINAQLISSFLNFIPTIADTKRHHFSSNKIFTNWAHAVHLFNNPCSLNDNIGKLKTSWLITYYTKQENKEQDLFIHTARYALAKCLELNYEPFKKEHGSELNEENLPDAQGILELYLMTKMNPLRIKTSAYNKLRKDIFGLIKNSGQYAFLEVLFDFILFMNPQKKDMRDLKNLRTDIQLILPLYSKAIRNFPTEFWPINSLSPSNDSISRKYASNNEAVSTTKIIRSLFDIDEYSKGKKNKLMQEIGEDFSLPQYVDHIILKDMGDLQENSLLKLIETHLQVMFPNSAKSSDSSNQPQNSPPLKKEKPVSDKVLDPKITEIITPNLEEPLTDESIEIIVNESTPPLPRPKVKEEVSAPLVQQEKANPSGKKTPESKPVNVQETNMQMPTLEDILSELVSEQPIDIPIWFGEKYKHFFAQENVSWVRNTYVELIAHLEQYSEDVSIDAINTWLLLKEILKILKTEFNYGRSPYNDNQRLSERFNAHRREAASNQDILQEKIRELVSAQRF